jgi:hypothetical protein
MLSQSDLGNGAYNSVRGYLHFYTTFLSKEVCLILISTKAGNFEAGMQRHRHRRQLGRPLASFS